jgi:hypothetical protein
MKIVLMAMLAVTLSGCATKGMYDWGGYDMALYKSYKEADKTPELIKTLEETIAETQENGHKVAPGLYAELGTLYLQAGSSEKAIAMYTRERDAWPESKGLMTVLITNLERRTTPSKEAAL